VKRLFSILMLSSLSAQAQTITETFGSGANQFSIDFVEIGNSGNLPDSTGFGNVSYNYKIAKYEISRDIFNKGFGEIIFNNPYTINRPAAYIRWYDAAEFVNRLNLSAGFHAAYKRKERNIGTWDLITKWSPEDEGYDPDNPTRNKLAKYVLPSFDEWYKAAYGSPSGDWFKYTTGSNSPPRQISSGVYENSSVFNLEINGTGEDASFNPANVNDAGSLSGWGTMGQGGNVAEFIEEDPDNAYAWLLGGAYFTDISYLDSSNQSSLSNSFTLPKDDADDYAGFRVGIVPEPSSLSLLLAGGFVLMAGRRRK